jgi:ubiquinone/menaquinone biosynthesis C-methylase UbiE
LLLFDFLVRLFANNIIMQKESLGKSDGFKIYSADGPLVDALPMMSAAYGFATSQINENRCTGNIASEMILKELNGMNIFGIQGAYAEVRNYTRASLIAILKLIFKKYSLPLGNGLDVGSGGSGEMVENLLSPIISKPSWTQTDVNMLCLARNVHQHPDSRIEYASYLNLRDDLPGETFDIVTGLSALDNTVHIERAISEIRQVLVEGGYLLHVQDVLPAQEIAQKELLDNGIPLPHVVKKSVLAPVIASFLVPEEGFVSTQELFRRQIGRVIENNPDLELIMNDHITCVSGFSPRPFYASSGVFVQQRLPILSLRKNHTSAIVTLAKAV